MLGRGVHLGHRYVVINVIGEDLSGVRYGVDPLGMVNIVPPSPAIQLHALAPSLSSTFIDELMRGAEAAVRFGSVHVVQLFDIGQIDGVFYVTWPRVPAVPLSALLEAKANLPGPIALRVLREVALGLASIHARRERTGVTLTHGAVCERTVIVTDRGVTQLSDFPLTWALRRPSEGVPMLYPSEVEPLRPSDTPRPVDDDIDVRRDLYGLFRLAERLLAPAPVSRDLDAILVALARHKTAPLHPWSAADVAEAFVGVDDPIATCAELAAFVAPHVVRYPND